MNEAVPIGRLPPEILAEVLEFRESDKDLISATHVCSRWRSALTSAPSLWTKVVFQGPDRALTYLTRSGALPIEVSFGSWNTDPKDFHTNHIPWLDRVQSMELRGDKEEIKAIARRLCLPAPLLRSLKLNGKSNLNSPRWWNPGEADSLGEFFGGQAPLRSLSLDFIPPALVAQFPITNLTSLTWADENSPANVERVLKVLGLTPLLESLTLDLRVPIAHDGMKIVTLSRLRELNWSNSGGAFSLTSCLLTPKLSRLTLRVYPDVGIRQPTLASILPPHKLHFPLLLEPTEITYTTQSGTQVCQFRSPTTYLSVTVLRGSRTEVYTPWFFQKAVIPFERIKHMTMQTDPPSLGKFPTERFESLETLELVDGGSDNLKLIQPSFSQASTVIPFPTLREVRTTFGSKISLDGLEAILYERKCMGYTVNTVRIQGECDEDIKKAVVNIRKLVGEVELQLTHGAGCTGCE